MNAQVDEEQLLVRARSGDLGAFEALVRECSPKTYRVAMRLVNDHHDAEDITQEAFVAGWQSLSEFRSDASFSTWMYAIVTRKALDRLARWQKIRTVELTDPEPDVRDGPADTVSRTQSTDAVDAAVAQLPPLQRAVVVLHHFEGLSYAEVAAITSSTVPAVRSHLFRARRTLATTLREWR